MISEAALWTLLLAWRSEIISVPLPVLVDTDSAVAILAAARSAAPSVATVRPPP